MKKIRLVGLLATAVLLSGCGVFRLPTSVRGSGNVVTESRPVSGVNAVALSGFGELVIDQTGAESLSLEGDDNILPLVTTAVRDGTLTIDFKPNTIVRPTRLKFTLAVKSLNAIMLSGAGSITANNLSAEDFAVTSSGAGKITTNGKTMDQHVTLSGAGSYDGANFDSDTATVQVSGVGGAVVKVSRELNADISGVGSVEYIGSPQVTQEVSGVGSIKQRTP
jgi:hypothetical protein